MTTEAIEHELHSLAGDATTLEQLLGDGLVYIHSTGMADTKAKYLDGVRANRLQYRGIERQQQQIQIYGDTAVGQWPGAAGCADRGHAAAGESALSQCWGEGDDWLADGGVPSDTAAWVSTTHDRRTAWPA
ncbi:MAG: nuclear transport factor 2 family protein [Dehalococcoidia bacterium]